MTELWHEKNGTKMETIMGPEGFNGGDILILDRDDILSLQTQVENDSLPFCPDGFFWGQQFQEESMKDFKQQDLKFCKDALQWLEEGKEVWYESSW